MLEDTLLYFLAPFLPLIPVLVYRKRLIAYIARTLGPYIAASVVSWAFVEEEVEDAEGVQHRVKRISAPAKALLAAVVPVLIAEVAKNVKLKLPTGGVLPAGIDITNLSEMLPAILPMIPKKYQGIAALAMPFLGPLLGGLGKPGTGTKPGKETVNPFLKELTP